MVGEKEQKIKNQFKNKKELSKVIINKWVGGVSERGCVDIFN